MALGGFPWAPHHDEKARRNVTFRHPALMTHENIAKGTTMAKPAGQLVVGIYPSDENATVVFDMLKRMHTSTNITLIDAARVTKDKSGKVHVQETEELTARKGAVRGAVITGIFGLIYPPSLLASAAVGGGLGALIGRVRDIGIKGAKFKDIAAQLTPETVAIAVLVPDASVAQVETAMQAMEGRLVVQPIDDEALKQIYIEQQKHEQETIQQE
jgi:uncharacterized membrane protein